MGDGLEYCITREEFNSLYQRLSDLREQCIGCKTKMEADVVHLTEEQKDLKCDIIEIKQAIKELSDKLNALTIRITTIVGILVTAINLLIPYLLKKFG
jgi:seryl-tRNA synthetase